MCDVLSDIEVAQDLLEPKREEEEQKVELQPHPADEKYATLKAGLKIIQPKEEEYRIIEKYCQVGRSMQHRQEEEEKYWQLQEHVMHMWVCGITGYGEWHVCFGTYN